MLYVLWFLSLLLLLLCHLSSSKSDTVIKGFLVGFSLLVFFIIVGWSSGAYDIEIGRSRYINYEYFSSFTEQGYTFLVKKAHQLGLSYRTFAVICAAFEISVLVWFFKKNTVDWKMALVLFIYYPFVIYFQYTRNILAFAFVMIAIDNLLHKKKRYISKYIILIMVAMSIHMSATFFLLYLLVCVPDKKKLNKIVVVASVALLILGSSINKLYAFVTYYLGDQKTDILTRSTSASGQFGRIFAIVCSICVFFMLYYRIRRYDKELLNDELSDKMYTINLISFIFIPMTLYFGIGFARLITLLLPINYAFLTNKISYFGHKRKKYLYICLFAMLTILLILQFRNVEYRELVLYPFFEENELIETINTILF